MLYQGIAEFYNCWVPRCSFHLPHLTLIGNAVGRVIEVFDKSVISRKFPKKVLNLLSKFKVSSL